MVNIERKKRRAQQIERKERLAQQLRANLKKRKQQARARKDDSGDNARKIVQKIAKTPEISGKRSSLDDQTPGED